MAKKLPPKEKARTLTDFDPPTAETKETQKAVEAQTKRKKGQGKGNPNGRPPSLEPRRNYVGVNLTDAERDRLNEAARILDTTKTKIIVEGIGLVYLQAKKQERQQAKEAN